MQLLRYFARLPSGRVVLWCYLIWYLSTVARYFDPSPGLWLNALGISLVVGLALRLSVSGGASAPDRWQSFRLFFMPFAVSSFSALIKGHGFVLVFPPSPREWAGPLGLCAAFVLGTAALRRSPLGRAAPTATP